MNKTFLTLTTIFLSLGIARSQDFSKCKIDFSLLATKERFSSEDKGKELVFVDKFFPKYQFVFSQKQSVMNLKSELKKKLLDNKDYNKDNLLAKDSLNQYYNNLIISQSFSKVVWKEYVGDATKEELKAFNNNKKLPNNILTTNEYSLYLASIISEIEENKPMGKDLEASLPDLGFNSVEDALNRITEIKLMDAIIVLKEQKKYKIHEKNISGYDPLFIIGKTDSLSGASLQLTIVPRFTKYNNFTLIDIPTSQKPVFESSELKNRKIILERCSDPFQKQMTITLDDKIETTLYNYFFNSNEIGIVNKSAQLLYEKERLNRVNVLLSDLKTKKLTIKINEELFANATIENLNFLYDGIEISFDLNGKKTSHIFNSKSDVKYNYSSGYKRATNLSPVYNFPIYNSDCYIKQQELYDNLVLPKDKINDEQLKNKLFSSMVNSTLWMNYKIEKVILTNESVWTIETNKFTGLKQNRYLLAEVYFKSTKTGKCYYETIYFSQKLDPLDTYTYSINMSEPELLNLFPCNLK